MIETTKMKALFTYENKIGDVYERCIMFNNESYDQIVVTRTGIELHRKGISRFLPVDVKKFIIVKSK